MDDDADLTLKDWIAGIAGLVVLLVAARMLGEAFRAYTLLFMLGWVALPAVACLLNHRSLMACFTVVGLRRVRVILMILVVAISFAVFGHGDDFRNRFGRQFVTGYVYWPREVTDDDYSDPPWTAENFSGRLAVHLFEWTLLVGVFGLPFVVWKGADSAISRKQE